MRALVVFALKVLTTVASADRPRAIPLAREPARMLTGHVALRLAAPMVPLDASTAAFDWGATRFTLTVAIGAPDGDLRDRIAHDRELGIARVERLAIVHAGIAYGAAPSLPRIDDGRALVYVAYRAAADGSVGAVRFYVSASDLDEAAEWSVLARRIAMTLEVYAGSPPLRGPPPMPRPPLLVGGWKVSWDNNHQHLTAPHGACDVVDGELDVHPTAPTDATHLDGELRGETMYWNVWVDNAGHHAEAMVGAALRGQIHAQCLAATSYSLAALRAVVEQLWR